jgi:hypothetical protein
VTKSKGWTITLSEETSLDDTAGVVEIKGLTSDCREEEIIDSESKPDV